MLLVNGTIFSIQVFLVERNVDNRVITQFTIPEGILLKGININDGNFSNLRWEVNAVKNVNYRAALTFEVVDDTKLPTSIIYDHTPSNKQSSLSTFLNTIKIDGTSKQTIIDIIGEEVPKFDQTAADVPVTPTGELTSENVQDSLEEHQSDIDSLDTRISANESNISSMETDIADLRVDVDNASDGLGNHKASQDLDLTNFDIIDVNLVDGRDVSVDGAKLDGIETGATADQDADEVPYDNTASGLTASNTQDAIDEVEDRVDTLEASPIHNPITIAADGVSDDALSVDGSQVLTANLATTGTDGLMSSGDKTKLDGIEASAKDDQVASEVPVTPVGNLMQTDVQAALAYLQSEIDAGGVGDNLGTHTATQNLNMATFEIINVGNVDGRDVSADGSKLDTIESNAKDDQDASEVSVAHTAVNYTPTGATVEGHIEGIDSELATSGDISTVTPQGDGSFRHTANSINTDISFELDIDLNNISIINSANSNTVNTISRYQQAITNQVSSTSNVTGVDLHQGGNNSINFRLGFTYEPTSTGDPYSENISGYYFHPGYSYEDCTIEVSASTNITWLSGGPGDIINWNRDTQSLNTNTFVFSHDSYNPYTITFQIKDGTGTLIHTINLSGELCLNSPCP
jgi:hypothetical protein